MESFTSSPQFLPSTLDWLRTFLAGFHSFHASLMAIPPPQFHSSTLLDRDGTSHSAVLTDIMIMIHDGSETRRCSHVYEVNTRAWLWNFGRPQPRVASLSVAKTEKVRKRCRAAAAKSSWETRWARKRAAEADADI